MDTKTSSWELGKEYFGQTVRYNEERVLSYGTKHSLAPKHLPTAKILASVEAAISYNDDLSIEVKEAIRSKVASTLQTSRKPVNNLTKDEQLALSRLRNDDTIVITPADKGRVSVVMNKTEYHQKMCNLVNDDITYKRLKKDPFKKLQRKLNEKLYLLHQANILKKQIYSRLYCSVAQTPNLAKRTAQDSQSEYTFETNRFVLFITNL